MKSDSIVTFDTIGAALLESARRWPDSTAIVFPEERWSYTTLLARASERARALHGFGLGSGDVIALAMAEEPEFIALFLGAAMCGVTAVLFDPGVRGSTPTPRLPHQRASAMVPRLAFLDIKLFLASAHAREFANWVAEAHSLARRPLVPQIHIGSKEYTAFLEGAAHDFDVAGEARAVNPAQLVAMVFTSGMTGLPKTCSVSHRNLMCKAAPLAERFELACNSRLWVAVPMFQIGFVAPFLTALASGATIVAPCSGELDAIRAQLKSARITHAYPIYLGNWLPIIAAPTFQASDLPELSHICLVGPTSALRRVQRATPQATVMNTYGSAETAGAFCMPRASDPIEVRLATSGRPFPGHEVRIVDPKSAQPLSQGRVGEIQVRGEGIPQGHPGNEYGSVFTDDGWLRTSDLGLIGQDGVLIYQGRTSELLMIGGEAVSATTIETVLALNQDVAVAQVISRPDPVLGEAAAAFIELRPGRVATPEQIVEFCRKHLPAAHVPRYVTFVTEWPTAASKVYKPKLANMPLGPRLVE